MEELKNKIYELEGLVELASKREDKFDALRPLISGRLEEVRRLWNELAGETVAPSASVSTEKEQAESRPEEYGEPVTINDIYRLRRENQD